MQKIPTLFLRDHDDPRRPLTDQVNPECQWVIDGEGVATAKADGTCVMFGGKDWFARREVKPGKQPPAGFIEVSGDVVTGKKMGWVPVDRSDPNFRYHVEAIDRYVEAWGRPAALTYELMGPKVQGNPMGLMDHRLWRHDALPKLHDAPRSFVDLREYLLGEPFTAQGWEGLVWHHPDGRRAKLKVKDLSRTTT